VDVSVVLCTRNRSACLGQALSSLAAQQAGVRWEVLVVDNASEDDTADVVRQRAPGFPVPLRLEHEPQRGLSFARNRALATARGAVLLYIDDDATCRPGWLAAQARAFDDPAVVGTGGRIVPVVPDGAPPWFRAEAMTRIGGPSSRYDFGDEPQAVGAGTRCPPPFGANMGVRRDAAAGAGGFRTDLGWGRVMIPGEDTDLMVRLQAQGGRLVYVPGATVDHHLALERCNRDYFVRWYRGFGRAAIRRNPPRTRLEAWRKAAGASRKVAAWWLFSLPAWSATGNLRYGSVLRKHAAALGRLEALLA
jgi:glycosyltransferase involved in cell wall biosynthesis